MKKTELNYKDFVEILDASHKSMAALPGRVKISGNEIQVGDIAKLAIIQAAFDHLTKKKIVDGAVDFDLFVKIPESIDDVNG